MFDTVLGAFTSDLAIDLGTANTRVAIAGQGVVCRKPSVAAVQYGTDGNRQLVAVGDDALKMEGRTPKDVRIVRPIQDGAVSDFEVAEAMLRVLLVEVQGRRLWVGPRVVIAMPHGTTDMERRAVREAVEASGARSVTLVDQPLSAAIGMGLPVHEARGHLIIDVGAGATDVSVLSLGGVVHSHTMRVGGDQMDQAIAHAVKSRLGIEISRAMAEQLKFRFANDGVLGPREPVEEPTMVVRGRHIKSGYPASTAIPVSLVKDALAEPVRMLVDAVVRSLEFTPPDLAADIAQTGALMTGGGALHAALPRTVQDATGLPVIVPEDPICAVVLGASKYLEDPAGLFVRAS